MYPHNSCSVGKYIHYAVAIFHICLLIRIFENPKTLRNPVDQHALASQIPERPVQDLDVYDIGMNGFNSLNAFCHASFVSTLLASECLMHISILSFLHNNCYHSCLQWRGVLLPQFPEQKY